MVCCQFPFINILGNFTLTVDKWYEENKKMVNLISISWIFVWISTNNWLTDCSHFLPVMPSWVDNTYLTQCNTCSLAKFSVEDKSLSAPPEKHLYLDVTIGKNAEN